MGIYVYSPAAVERIPEGCFDFPDLVLALIADGAKSASTSFDGPWYDIGTPAEHAGRRTRLRARRRSSTSRSVLTAPRRGSLVRILIVSQYFEPELTAASIRLGAFAAGLAAAGHEVQVLCEVPNHPHGSRRAGLPRPPRGRSRADGLSGQARLGAREPVEARAHRSLSYASFAASAAAVGSPLRAVRTSFSRPRRR